MEKNIQISRQIQTFYSLSIKNKMYTNKERLKCHLEFMFGNASLAGKRVLDVGGGAGLLTFFAAANGASATCLEPELKGSTTGIATSFNKMSSELNLRMGEATLIEKTFQQFKSKNLFDIIILANSINHLDEEASLSLQFSSQAQIKMHRIFQKMFSMLTPGGRLIITDCDRRNFFNDLKTKSPFMPDIEWDKHQSPFVWINLLKKAGFKKESIKWSSPNSLGRVGRFFFGNRLTNYFLLSHFRIELYA